MATRDYDQGALTVHWDSSRCIHSANCIRAQPGVFRPRERPWIDVSAADADAIAAAVDTCPSGALAYTWADGREEQAADGEQVAADPAEVATGRVRIRVTANGPYEVEGDVEIVDDDGSPVKLTDKTWLCRCGHSSNKPFCDGSHGRFGFTDPRTAQ